MHKQYSCEVLGTKTLSNKINSVFAIHSWYLVSTPNFIWVNVFVL